MYIGIDGNEANREDRVGVNQYAYEILHGLYRLNNSSSVKNNFIIYLKNEPQNFMPSENEFWKYKILPGGGRWVLTKLQQSIALDPSLDVFFSPHHYLPPLSRVPKVCAIHDLGYLEFSEQFRKYDFWQLKYWTAISIYVSKYIITFSEFTKTHIVRRYPFTSEKTFVVHHGYSSDLYNPNISDDVVRRVLKKYKLSKKYILFLGTLKPSKNIEGLVEAYRLLKTKGCDYRLVIAGKKGWLYKGIFEKVKNLGLEKEISFTDFVDESDKPGMIKGAKLFVLPSFWEGFGMDILTAYACGVPVVGSDVASISEVGGDALIKCDPYSPESMAESINKVLNMNPGEYNTLVRKCLRRAGHFSWDEAAIQTLEVLKRIKK